MPSQVDPEFRPDFRVITGKLRLFALRRGVPYEDALDIVQSAIIEAIDRFDGTRGNFHALCCTILASRIKNFWRDRKKSEPVEIEDIPDSDTPDPFVRPEEESRMKRMIERIEKELTPEESLFLKALGNVLEQMDSRAVSEAARNLGIEPSKGWDIFRRIQRKAGTLYPRIRCIAEPAPARAVGKPARILTSQKKHTPPAAPPAPGKPPGDLVEARFSSLVSDSLSIGFREEAHEFRTERASLLPSICDIAQFAEREAWCSRILGALTPRQASKLRDIFV